MFLTSVAICCVIGVWNVPFRFRLNSVTDRAIVCNVPFTVSSLEAKRLAIDRARWEAPHVFVNDSQPLVEIRKALWNTVAALVNARSYDYLDERGKKIWLEFLTPNGKGEIPPNTDASTAFDAFAAYFKEDTDFSRFDKKLQIVFTPFVTSGILTVLPYGPERGSQETILVYRSEDSPDRAMPFKVSEVLIRDGALLREGLQKQLNNQTVADQLFNWLLPRLVDTLKDNPNATAEV
ncbi:hypothetical protein FACS1894189_6970 [Planctomycetales bacterium]|nr:hypothetical protein FACS1894189_6970 [Planctomycetales bacterium]